MAENMPISLAAAEHLDFPVKRSGNIANYDVVRSAFNLRQAFHEPDAYDQNHKIDNDGNQD